MLLHFRDIWSAYRSVTEPRYRADKWYNLRQALRARGTLRFPGGTRLGFDATNKRARFQLLKFALAEGFLFNAAEARGFGWKLDAGAGVMITPQGISLWVDSFHELIFLETFVREIHFADFHGRDRLVVDAGGFVGDTALYYAAYGFRVVTLEPDLERYRWAERNVALNPGLAPRITLVHSALGIDGEVAFATRHAGGGSIFGQGEVETVPSMSLRTLLSRYSNASPFLLHLDVKGVEFSLIDSPEIDRFERVRLEYTATVDGRHLGRPDELVAKLHAKGFVGVRVYKHNAGAYPLAEHGTIDAAK